MFTICVYIFVSQFAVTPIEARCFEDRSQDDVNKSVAQCRQEDKSPATTCESQRVGALKWFIRVRRVDGLVTP
jgi:hypothetical protein